jgi:hypothetical protein
VPFIIAGVSMGGLGTSIEAPAAPMAPNKSSAAAKASDAKVIRYDSFTVAPLVSLYAAMVTKGSRRRQNLKALLGEMPIEVERLVRPTVLWMQYSLSALPPAAL